MPWYPFKLTGKVFADNEDTAINRVEDLISDNKLIRETRIEGPNEVQPNMDLGCLQGRYMTRQGEK